MKKSKCPSCESGNLNSKRVSQYLKFDGVPEFKLDGVLAEVCDKCGEEYVSATELEKRDLEFLKMVWDYYQNNSGSLPGKAALWMRKMIGKTAREWAKESGCQESTISHATQRNSEMDRFAAIVLLLWVKDFISQGSVGQQTIDNLNNLESFYKVIQPEIIVQQIRLEMPKRESLPLNFAMAMSNGSHNYRAVFKTKRTVYG